MCIIVVHDVGVELDKEHLRNCSIANPDGMGFMYQDFRTRTVVIKKGFMTFDEFFAEYSKLPTNVARAAHFRIATSGRVCKETTHPFPLTDNYKDYEQLEFSSDYGVMHNGIISWCTPTARLAAQYSDTMIFLKEYLFPMRDELFKKPIFDNFILHSTSSKFVIMTPRKVKLIGSFIKEEGAYYSNSTYKYAREAYSYGGYGFSSLHGWEKDDDEDNFYGEALAGYKKKDPDPFFVKSAKESANIIEADGKSGDDEHAITSFGKSHKGCLIISIPIKGYENSPATIDNIISTMEAMRCNPLDWTMDSGELRVKCITVPLTSTISGFAWGVRNVVAADDVSTDSPISIASKALNKECIDIT